MDTIVIYFKQRFLLNLLILYLLWLILLVIVWNQNYLPQYLLWLYLSYVIFCFVELIYKIQKGYVLYHENYLMKRSFFKSRKINFSDLKHVQFTPYYIEIIDQKRKIRLFKHSLSRKDFRFLETKLKTKFHLGSCG
ncbi:MAG: hypothetical protein OXE77_03745 [Flavobacteriaceae bacterium]|nr:hypothetical protein [Flavobacteriaceae bacterium]MCY4267951.1 hypothetical protein [Flavobacteriaceae bacterium]